MTAGYLFSGVLFQLPMLAVLVIGVVLIGSRRPRIGPRSALLGQIGLIVLIFEVIAQTAWSLTFPRLLHSMDASVSQFGLLSSAVGLMLSALVTAGVGLLIAAVVTGRNQPSAV
ncbi:hypothetical protein [Jidongwangia harbinensis]|uniref:hypothetical protein n=1 Tax=Jidongwangia harbinensis TaxID=2878561 RepID=UPI001CDA1578|nr:hypothetical protein [Jidongwangia harbinensis]MCA2213534.1 hypothetical protein [Jidongwangia harbinensis]